MMLRRAFMLLALLPFVVAADNSGCQSEDSASVDQDRINTQYWLYYDANSNSTYARAQFRFGSEVGTTLILEEPASVTFAGKKLAFNELLDWQEVVLPGKVATGTFEYVDAKGKTYRNAVAEMPELQPGTVPASLASGQPLEVIWSGAPLGQDDALETIVAHTANPFLFVRVDQRNQGATNVVVPANDLARLPRGPAKLGLRLYRERALAEGSSAGGKITTTYQPIDRDLTLQ